MSDYILTFSKIKFYPLDPLKDDIKIEDIAHSLSLMTRANGHFSHFYSVAQHSVNCCKEAQSRGYSDEVQLGCLLHDASESYISDLTRPVKQHFPEYFIIEEKLQKLTYDKFGLVDLSTEDLNKTKDGKPHKFYDSIQKVNIGALPFLPGHTKLAENFLDELILDTPETAVERSVFHEGTEQYYNEKFLKKNVFVGYTKQGSNGTLTIDLSSITLP
jgi:5'-deoxynucleotidase YfbR-like HD superfamily hydrolase